MGNPNCVRYCDYDGSCAAGKEIDRLKAELAAAREEIEHHKQKRIESMAARAKLRALLVECFDCYKNDWMTEEQRQRFEAAGRGEDTK
jgi:hypothetical protein